mgnify:CR=1 FL=1
MKEKEFDEIQKILITSHKCPELFIGNWRENSEIKENIQNWTYTSIYTENGLDYILELDCPHTKSGKPEVFDLINNQF